MTLTLPNECGKCKRIWLTGHRPPAPQAATKSRMIAAQIEAELTNLRKLRQKYGQHELRITCVGASKAGKTTFAVRTMTHVG
jgi:hypothetical protein